MHVQELPSDIREIGVLDSRMQVNTKVYISIEIGDVHYDWTAYVVDKVQDNVIGNDFLGAYELKQLCVWETTPSEQFTPNQ